MAQKKRTTPFEHAILWLQTQWPEDQAPAQGTLGAIDEIKFGLSRRDHRDLDFKKLSKGRAIGIYKKNFWDALPCDKLPTPLAVAVFDCAADQGVNIAQRLLCNVLGINPNDDMPEATSETFANLGDWSLVVRFNALRLRRYAFTGGNHQLMTQWATRVLNLQDYLIQEVGQEAS